MTQKEIAISFLQMAGAGDVKRVYEEGNIVITHSQVLRADPEGTTIVVVHIFRFANDHVVELRDVGQVIPANRVNANGAF